MSRNLKGFVEYSIHPSSDEIAEVLWAMDTEEQAYFFNRLAEVSKGGLVMQLQYLTDNPYLTTEARVVMKRIGEYADKIEPEAEPEMAEQEEIEYYLFEDGRVTGKRYRDREKFWEEFGLYRNGYTAETKQVHFSLQMFKGDRAHFEKTVRALEKVLPYLREDQDGVKRLGVFEHTLSEYGVYVVEIFDGFYQLNVWRWGSKSQVATFGNLVDLVSYVQEHHYYEDLEN